MSIHDQLQALDEQRAKLLGDAKAKAIDKANEAIKELNDLGLHYRLREGKASSGPRKKDAKTIGPKRQIKVGPCPICHFETRPRHDGRSHRGQEPKKAFTAHELTAKGFSKVG